MLGELLRPFGRLVPGKVLVPPPAKSHRQDEAQDASAEVKLGHVRPVYRLLERHAGFSALSASCSAAGADADGAPPPPPPPPLSPPPPPAVVACGSILLIARSCYVQSVRTSWRVLCW